MILDLIVLGIILVFGIIGHYKGFVKTIMSFGSSLVAVVLAFIIQPIISGFLMITPLYGVINKWIVARVEKINFGVGVQTQGEAIKKGVTWLPEFMSEQIIRNNNVEVYKLLEVSGIKDYVSTSLTRMVIALLAILIAWMIIKVLLMVLLTSTDGVVKAIPVISGLNRVCGFGIGLAKGVLGIWVVGLILPTLLTIPSFSQLGTFLEKSNLTQWLYENNILLQVFSELLSK